MADLNSDDPFAEYATPEGAAPAPEADDPFAAYAAAEPQAEEPGWVSRFTNYVKNSPAYFSEVTTKAEIESVAKKYGVPVSVLETGLDLNTAKREFGEEDASIPNTVATIAKRLAGTVSGMAGDAPYKIYKQIAYDENTQRAIDEITAMADQKRSWYDATVKNVALPGFTIGASAIGRTAQAAAKAQSLASKAGQYTKLGALSAPTGALYGYGGSRTGEELESAAIGAGIGFAGGTVLAPALDVGVSAIQKARASKAAKKIVDRASTDIEARIETRGLDEGQLEDLRSKTEELDFLIKEVGGNKEDPRNARISELEQDIRNITKFAESQAEMDFGEAAMKGEHTPFREWEGADEFPVMEANTQAKVDTLYAADSAYKAKEEVELAIADDMVKIARGEEPDNLFLGEWIFKRKHEDKDKADKLWNDMVLSLQAREGIESLTDAELMLSQRFINEDKLKLAKTLDATANKHNVDSILKLHSFGAGSGEAGVRKAYESVARTQYALNYLEKNKDALIGIKKGPDWEDFVTHAYAPMEKADVKYGTALSPALDEAINGIEMMGVRSIEVKEKAKDPLKKINAIPSFAGRDGGARLAQLVEEGETGARALYRNKIIDKDEYLAARELADFIYDVGSVFRASGLEFTFRKARDGSAGYFPVRTLPPDELRRVLSAEYKELQGIIEGRDFLLYKDIKPPTEKQLKELSSEKLEALLEKKRALEAKQAELKAGMSDLELEQLQREKDFIRSLSNASGTKIGNREQIRDAMLILMDASEEGTSRLHKARATMHRQGYVPDIIREFNPAKVLEDYVNDGFKQLALKDPLAKLEAQKQILIKAGDSATAKYVDEVVEYMLTGRERSMFQKLLDSRKEKYAGQINALQARRKSVIDEAVSAEIEKGNKITNFSKFVDENVPEAKTLAKQIEKLRFKQEWLPATVSTMRGWLSTSLLGGNIKAPLRDLWSPYTMGIQHIGNIPYGGAVMSGATLDTMKALKSFRKMEQELVDLGHMSKEFQGQLSASREIQDFRSEMLKYGEEKAAKLTAIFMSLRRGAEVINRYNMLSAARRIAKDYMSAVPSKGAKEFIDKRIGSGYNTEIRKLQSRGELTEEKLVQMVANDLIGRTQFRYHPAMRSKMARNYGPLVTQFTHYPSGVASAFSVKARKEGAKAAIGYALAPLAAMYAASHIYDSIKEGVFGLDPDTMSPREKALFYSKGVKEAAPIMSLPGIIPGQGPEAKMYSTMAKLITEAEPSEEYMTKVGKTLAKSGGMLTPYGASKNVYDTMYRLILNEDPDE